MIGNVHASTHTAGPAVAWHRGEAFERLYRDNFGFVWAVTRRLGVPAAVVDDAVQDVFVTAYRKLHQLDWEVSPRGWLYGVARRVAFRYRRSSHRAHRRTSALGREATVAEEPHRRHDAVATLDRLLATLEDGQRETFVMAEILGMTGPEIAAEHCVPLDTVYSRLRLARRRLSERARASGRLDDIIETGRREDVPPRDRQHRVWAVMAPVIARLGESGVTLGSSVAISFIPAVLGVLTVVSIALTTRGLVPAPAPADLDATGPTATARSEPSTDAPQPSAELESPAAAPAIAMGPHREAVASTRETPPTTKAPAPERPAPASASSIPVVAQTDRTDDLAAELALVEAARRDIARGDLASALTRLNEHGSRFPEGELGDVVLATRVGALCALGRHEEARAAHDRLQAAFPGSNVRSPTRCW